MVQIKVALENETEIQLDMGFPAVSKIAVWYFPVKLVPLEEKRHKFVPYTHINAVKSVVFVFMQLKMKNSNQYWTLSL